MRDVVFMTSLHDAGAGVINLRFLGGGGGRKTRHFRAIFPGRPPGGVQVSRSCLVR